MGLTKTRDNKKLPKMIKTMASRIMVTKRSFFIWKSSIKLTPVNPINKIAASMRNEMLMISSCRRLKFKFLNNQLLSILRELMLDVVESCIEACFGCWAIELTLSSFELRYKHRHRYSTHHYGFFLRYSFLPNRKSKSSLSFGLTPFFVSMRVESPQTGIFIPSRFNSSIS